MIEPLLSDDAFLASVAATREATDDGFRLWWLGQSGFLVQWRRRHILLDPYLSDSLTRKYADTDKPHVRMTRRVVAPERLDFIDLVTSSHSHTDHLDADTLRPILSHGESVLIVPAANVSLVCDRLGMLPALPVPLNAGQSVSFAQMRNREAPPDETSKMIITAVPAAHEALEPDEQGRHRFLGYILQLGRWVLYHSGDTVLYDGMVERLRPFNIDVALLPINGRAPERRVAGNLNGREASWLAKEVGAKVVIPCHYEMFEFNTASPDEFMAECARLGQPYRVLRAGERFSNSELPPNTAPAAPQR